MEQQTVCSHNNLSI